MKMLYLMMVLVKDKYCLVIELCVILMWSFGIHASLSNIFEDGVDINQ